MSTSTPSPDTKTPLLVACLCARWCDLCGQYQAVFDAAAARLGAAAIFVWVDIEDDEDLLGAIDVENFPTLLIADPKTALFFGPLTPQPATLQRMLQTALAGDLPPLPDLDTAELTDRIRAATERLRRSAGPSC